MWWVTRYRFTSPGPDRTPSTSARPARSMRARSTSMPRSLLAAKSACPPSDGDGTKRPLTLCNNASPRPVPAAMSAMLPPRRASPALDGMELGRLQHRHRVSHRLEIVQERRAADAEVPRHLAGVHTATARL